MLISHYFYFAQSVPSASPAESGAPERRAISPPLRRFPKSQLSRAATFLPVLTRLAVHAISSAKPQSNFPTRCSLHYVAMSHPQAFLRTLLPQPGFHDHQARPPSFVFGACAGRSQLAMRSAPARSSDHPRRRVFCHSAARGRMFPALRLRRHGEIAARHKRFGRPASHFAGRGLQSFLPGHARPSELRLESPLPPPIVSPHS